LYGSDANVAHELQVAASPPSGVHEPPLLLLLEPSGPPELLLVDPLLLVELPLLLPELLLLLAVPLLEPSLPFMPESGVGFELLEPHAAAVMAPATTAARRRSPTGPDRPPARR